MNERNERSPATGIILRIFIQAFSLFDSNRSSWQLFLLFRKVSSHRKPPYTPPPQIIILTLALPFQKVFVLRDSRFTTNGKHSHQIIIKLTSFQVIEMEPTRKRSLSDNADHQKPAKTLKLEQHEVGFCAF